MNPLIKAKIDAMLANHALTPATLAKILDPTWEQTAYLLKLSAILATKIRKGNARLLISLPPRHGKSKLVTEIGGTWFLENFPDKRLVLSSYGAALSTTFSRKIRDHFLTNPKLTGKVRADVANVNEWELEAGGGCTAVGIGGALTGKGADLLVLDDYLKDIAEASNLNNLKATSDWFKTVAYTRLHPGASCVVVATRWDINDLIGELEKTGRWDVINFPAIAMENDILGRAVGEPLFPERYPLDYLEDRKETLGSFFFSALYQQTPKAKDQIDIKKEWWDVIDANDIDNLYALPKIRTWDLAATENAGDYTVGCLAAYDRQSRIFYILDIRRGQLSSAKVEELVEDTAEEDGLTIPIGIEQEPGASGKTLVDIYKRALPDNKVIALPPSGSKLVRAQPLLAAAEAGRVKLIRAHWNDKFIDEICEFLTGKHDDQVDTAAHAFNHLVSKNKNKATWGGQNTETTGLNREQEYRANRVIFGKRTSK